MNQATAELEVASHESMLSWAAERHVDVNVTQCIDGEWQTFRAVFGSFDAQKNTIVLQEVAEKQSPNAVLQPDVEVGVAFRRGHKKCLFTTKITGQEGDTLLLQEPTSVRAVQRRAYQRVNIPSHRFIPVKVWEGSLPNSGEVCFPVCSGRVANISMGGVLVDVRSDQNPRLQEGDMVGIEIIRRPDVKPLLLEGQFRHCVTTEDVERISLGFQFLGLEHDLPGRSGLSEVAEYVRGVRRGL